MNRFGNHGEILNSNFPLVAYELIKKILSICILARECRVKLYANLLARISHSLPSHPSIHLHINSTYYTCSEISTKAINNQLPANVCYCGSHRRTTVIVAIYRLSSRWMVVIVLINARYSVLFVCLGIVLVRKNGKRVSSTSSMVAMLSFSLSGSKQTLFALSNILGYSSLCYQSRINRIILLLPSIYLFHTFFLYPLPFKCHTIKPSRVDGITGR